MVSPLGQFTLLGTMLTWTFESSRFGVGYFNLTMSTRLATGTNKPAVIDTWANESQKDARSKNVQLNRTPFSIGKFVGVELRSKVAPFVVTRAFFYGELLIIQNLLAKDEGDLNVLLRAANSFRPLSKTERIIALIDENTPPPLPRERPSQLSASDASEMGLRGPIRRIRESVSGKLPGEKTFTQEVNFDEDGFVTSETSFIDGFPDVITSWGWVSGNRVNREISVPYLGHDGPRYGRQMVITGELPIALPQGFIYKNSQGAVVDIRYGTRFETKYDEKRRPVLRKRFSNNGSLIFSQEFRYTDSSRETRTTDESGNFFSFVKLQLDGSGNVVEEQSVSDKGQILIAKQFKYEFDSNGNWIKRASYQTQAFGSKPGKKLIGHYTRDLAYYEESSKGPVAMIFAP